VNTVRFQPHRLANSKCYDANDSRIRSTACHDPHGELETNLASYEPNCAACHSEKLPMKVCGVAKTSAPVVTCPR
jgi:hypothetical protein